MIKHFLVAGALTLATVFFSDRATEPMVVIVPSDAEVELPIAGIEIVQGDRKETLWLYSDAQSMTEKASNDCDVLKRRFVRS